MPQQVADGAAARIPAQGLADRGISATPGSAYLPQRP